ncbi:MAG: DMT family transporter [Bauldia sp.]|nr:DMT family transporter [Bauldia sp.]
MAPDPRRGVALALLCLLILGVMPILATARPAGTGSLVFTAWMTAWQLVASLPLLIREHAAGHRTLLGQVPDGRRGRTAAVALVTGAMFGLSTTMYIVAADKAGPVNMAIALQAYPLFAILIEAVFLGKRKTGTELAFTALMLAALLYLVTDGTLLPSAVSWWSVFALGIPLIWSVAHILLRQILVGAAITPNQVTVSRLVISGIFLLVLALGLGEGGALAAAAADFALQKAAFLLGLAYYAELIVWFSAIRHLDVSVASSMVVPTPAVTMLIAVLFLGEGIALYQIVAMAVIALAMYGLLWAGRVARAKAIR